MSFFARCSLGTSENLPGKSGGHSPPTPDVNIRSDIRVFPKFHLKDELFFQMKRELQNYMLLDP